MRVGVCDSNGVYTSYSGPCESLLGQYLCDFDDDERFRLDDPIDETALRGIEWYERQYDNLIYDNDKDSVRDALFFVFQNYGFSDVCDFEFCGLFRGYDAEDFGRAYLERWGSASSLFKAIGSCADLYSFLDYDWIGNWYYARLSDSGSEYEVQGVDREDLGRDLVGGFSSVPEFLKSVEDSGFDTSDFIDYDAFWKFQSGTHGMYKVNDNLWFEFM